MHFWYGSAMLGYCSRRHGLPLGLPMGVVLCAARRPVRVLSSLYSVHTSAEMASKNAPKKAHYSSHFQICNVDNSTAAPSVLLFFDNKRYLFNAGEGIQRHFIEHKQKMSKITSVLATRVSTDTLAGLPGMLLSQVPAGSDGQSNDAIKSAVYGPAGLLSYCSAFRQYASNFKLSVHEIGSENKNNNKPTVEDNFVSIFAVPITPSSRSSSDAEPPKAAAADGQAAAAEQPAAKRQRIDSSSSKASLGPGMSPLAATVLCYMCQLSTIPGKIDPKKCAELGVPSGPMLGQLQRGNPVTLQNGKVIQPHEAMATEQTPGACLLVVDCPSLAYIPSLEAAVQLQQVQQEAIQQQSAVQQQQQQQAGNSSSNGPAKPTKRFVVIHLGPSSVTSSEPYKAWRLGFGPGVEHVMVSSDSQLDPTTLKAAVLQAQLNAIEPQLFSMQGFQSLLQQQQQHQQPPGSTTTAVEAANSAPSEDVQMYEAAAAEAEAAPASDQPSNVTLAANGFKYTLAPFKHQGPSLANVSKAPDLSAVQAGVRDEKRAVLLQLLEEYAAAKAAALQQPLPPQLQGIGRRSAELTLLGTCSACPSNHRNVSAYYLDLFDRGGVLMDCGEDTMGQLERRFGREDAATRILGLNAVWISHMHADHHGGLYPLLLRRQQLQQQQQQPVKPLMILGPWPLFRALCEYSRTLDLRWNFLPNTYFYAPAPQAPPQHAVEVYTAAKAAAGLTVLQPFPVQHIAHSTGLQLESEDGWKIVFSGDTRPCQSVIDAAKDATILVHEATFEDELQEDAIAKKHSTTAEALGVAAAAGAYRTVLTHFSTRYPKVPVMKPPVQAAGEQEHASSDAVAAAATPQAADAARGGSDLAAVGSVVVGFDLMSINLADLPWVPKTLPVLDELFKEEEAVYQQDDETAAV